MARTRRTPASSLPRAASPPTSELLDKVTSTATRPSPVLPSLALPSPVAPTSTATPPVSARTLSDVRLSLTLSLSSIPKLTTAASFFLLDSRDRLAWPRQDHHQRVRLWKPARLDRRDLWRRLRPNYRLAPRRLVHAAVPCFSPHPVERLALTRFESPDPAHSSSTGGTFGVNPLHENAHTGKEGGPSSFPPPLMITTICRS
jgi:hypothetical protein